MQVARGPSQPQGTLDIVQVHATFLICNDAGEVLGQHKYSCRLIPLIPQSTFQSPPCSVSNSLPSSSSSPSPSLLLPAQLYVHTPPSPNLSSHANTRHPTKFIVEMYVHILLSSYFSYRAHTLRAPDTQQRLPQRCTSIPFPPLSVA